MCGRFTLTVDPGELQEMVPGLIVPQGMSPRYNIAPTQPVAVVANTPDLSVDFYNWGLIPSWAKDPEIGNRLINARAETLAEKPSFRNAYKRRRCLILADGFFEWKQHPNGRGKMPMYIRMTSAKPFAFAGLWEIWSPPDGSQIRSCTIITTQPNELMQSIHNRMPVILPPEAYLEWLSPEERKPESLNHWLIPYPSEKMEAFPVSRVVNSPQNDVPECIQPLDR
jgi:putative SOS response-associated peptidase YedK